MRTVLVAALFLAGCASAPPSREARSPCTVATAEIWVIDWDVVPAVGTPTAQVVMRYPMSHILIGDAAEASALEREFSAIARAPCMPTETCENTDVRFVAIFGGERGCTIRYVASTAELFNTLEKRGGPIDQAFKDRFPVQMPGRAR